jgi:hypothetical protein
MAEFDTQYYKSSPSQPVEYAAATKCRYVEILHGPDRPANIERESFLDDASLPGWLAKVSLKFK